MNLKQKYIKKKKFSVLLSIYEKENPYYFQQCMESILNQTRRPDEIVLIKDGKLNQELEKIINYYVKKYQNFIKIYGYEEHKGLGYALRLGVLKCENEYIARMDTDDIARKDRFQIQMDYLESHTDIDIVGGYIQEYDEEMKEEQSVRTVPLSNESIYKSIGKQCPFNHGTIIAKKEAIIKSGNYPIYQVEDYALWIKMCMNHCIMANIPQVLVNFRTSENMYKRRSGIKYISKIKNIEDMLLENHFINLYKYFINMLVRTIVALIPSRMKRYIYSHIIRKC